ncbi:hypothetical protein HT031_000410 [Scenedesmus sp. PABB004]|nr:hypothetical protein HT031_000410 [Scenedesmus sp. PABB004]
MDSELLSALEEVLDVLAEARAAIEAEVALASAVNADLKRVVRRLQARPSGDEQALPEPAAQVLAQHRRPHLQPAPGAAGLAQQQRGQRPGSGRAGAAAPRSGGSAGSSGAGRAASVPAPAAPQPAAQAAEGGGRRGAAAPPALPAAFRELLARFAALQQQVGGHVPVPPAAGLTDSAAAGFMAGLDQAYGSAQPAGQSRLGAAAFSRQAEFVGLASAALAAVQALGSGGAVPAGDPELHEAARRVLLACELWCEQHEREATQPAADDEAVSAAARWQNRCLRGVLATAAALEPAAPDAATAAAAAAGSCSAAGPQLAVWLPEQCWGPLDAADGVDGRGGGSPVWRVLAPAGAAQTAPVALCYSDAGELAQHARAVQKLQQLLLHHHVEARLVPRLLECLLRGCLAVGGGRAAERQGGAAGATHERCLALFRLLHALTAGAPKRCGLGGGCHVVELQQVADAGWLDW